MEWAVNGQSYLPDADDAWETVECAEVGWDGAALDDLMTYLERQDSEQMLLVVDGRILREQCWDGVGPTAVGDVGSVQKSVVSLLVAILVERGTIAVEDPVSRWLGRGWTRAAAPQEDVITLGHLMSMCSGLFDDFSYEADPGQVWYYNNNGYHQVRKVLERATGRSTQDLCADLLFAPLGMTHSAWAERPTMRDPAGWPLSGLRTCARDLVRFGLLVLAGGKWGDRRLVEDPRHLGVLLETSQPLNPSYGLLWWLPSKPWALLPGLAPGAARDQRKTFGGRRLDHPIAPSAPADVKAAFGVGGQRLYVSAGLGLVLARRGRAVDDRVPFDEEIWRRLSLAAPNAPMPTEET